MNMAFVETYIAHCNKQRSLPKKYMLMTLKQNIFQKKLWVKGYKNLIEALEKLSFSQFLGDCYHKLSQFLTPRAECSRS